MKEKDFLDQVLEQIPRATGREKKEIRAELAAHLEDRIEVLEEAGYCREEAEARSVEAMGDGAEIGKSLNEQLSTFWLWVQAIAQGCIVMLLFLALVQTDFSGLVWRVRENIQARQGKVETVGVGGVQPTTEWTRYLWDSDDEMQVGDNRICLLTVAVEGPFFDEHSYRGEFVFCTYKDSIWKPAQGEIFEHITVIPESGVMIGVEYDWGWGGYQQRDGYITRRYWGLIQDTDSYVDVAYDFLGTRVEMRCELKWEEYKE